MFLKHRLCRSLPNTALVVCCGEALAARDGADLRGAWHRQTEVQLTRNLKPTYQLVR